MSVAQWLVLFAAAMLLAGPALADDGEVGQPGRKGTIFVGELSTGAAFGTGFSEGGAGLALRTSIGVGGALRGFPPRFYFLATVRYSLLMATAESGTLTSEIRRDLVDLSLGLRVLIPWRRLRFLGEVGLGDSILLSSARLNEREEFDTTEQRFAVYLATGLQYRLMRNLSFGLLLEWCIPTSRNVQDFVAEVSGVPDSREMMGWTALTATVVGHF